MRLSGDNSSPSVHLTPLGYEFERTTGDEYDDNWLLIGGAIDTPTESWSFTEPALLVDEALAIGRWLLDAAAGRVTPRRLDEDGLAATAIGGIEPLLGFDVIDGTPEAILLRVNLRFEAAPPRLRAPGDRDYSIDVTISPAALRDAAEEWLAEVRGFPARS